MAEPLAKRNTKDQEVLKLLYGSIWRMGDVEARGEAADQEVALGLYQDAEQILKALSPEDGANGRELMFVHQRIGDIHLKRGRFEAGITEYTRALSFIHGVASKAPNNRDWQRDLANAQRSLGNGLAAKGDFAGASEQLMTALDVLTKLASKEPNDSIGQSDLADTHHDIAELNWRRKDLNAALTEYLQATRIVTPLNLKNSADARWLFALARFHRSTGVILYQRNQAGDWVAAADEFRQAYEFRHQLLLKDPEKPDRRRALATAAMQYAEATTDAAPYLETAAREKSLKGAVERYRSAIAVLDDLLPRDDSKVFNCYINIGDILMLQDYPADALTEYKVAFGIAREFVKKDESDTVWKDHWRNPTRRSATLWQRKISRVRRLTNTRKHWTLRQRLPRIRKALTGYPRRSS